MISETSKRPANQWFLKDGIWYCIWLNAQLCTCGRTSQVGIQHRRSTEVPSCTFEAFGANCNLFWCIRWSSLLCLYQYALCTVLHLTLEHIFEKSVNSVDLTDLHVSSERQLWESMICNTISRPISQKSADFAVPLVPSKKVSAVSCHWTPTLDPLILTL